MVDHHVDRPGVEAQQCVKLTGTNRSFGFDPCKPQARFAGVRQAPGSSNQVPGIRFQEPGSRNQAPGTRFQESGTDKALDLTSSWILTPGSWNLPSDDLVVMARGQTPDPIPNSAVKTLERRWYCVLRRGRVGRRQVIGRQVSGIRNQDSGFRKLEVETRSLYSLLIPDP